MIDANILKYKVIYSLLWKFFERGGTQGIQFIIQIYLARLLLPEQYGVIAIVTVFISFAQVFVQSGFNTALIQKRTVDNVDLSSVLYLSLFIASLLYLMVYFSAPYISTFYSEPILTPVFRVLSISLFTGAFISIQNAYVARNLLFKKLFISSFGAVIISGIVGIIIAYNGYGVWALVVQQITSQFTSVIILWLSTKWRPNREFSIRRIKGLFSFGSKLLASSLVDNLYRNIQTLFVGKMYSPSMLGFYNRGQQFPQLIVENINGSIQSVMLPTLAAHQDDRNRVKEITRRAIVTSSFMIFPIMIGLAAVAEQIVRLLLTDKWLPSVPFIQILCFSFALWPIHTANLQAINAVGRSDIFLKLEIIKKIFGFVVLAISLPFGVYYIALGQVVIGIMSSFINAYPNRRLLSYSYKEQWHDIIPSLSISLTMGAAVYMINYFRMTAWLTLCIQICAGSILYILLAKKFRNESFEYLRVTLIELYSTSKKVSV